MTLNVADVTNYKLSETLAWNNKWLKASATLWGRRAHYSGIGGAFSGCVDNSNDWGWNVDAKATLGRGWLITTNFQYMGSYETMTSERNPSLHREAYQTRHHLSQWKQPDRPCYQFFQKRHEWEYDLLQ